MITWTCCAFILLMPVLVQGQSTAPQSLAVTSPPPCDDCCGRPSWAVFAASLVGTSVLTVLISFLCIQYAVSRNQGDERYSGTRRKSTLDAEKRVDRQRGRGQSFGFSTIPNPSVEYDDDINPEDSVDAPHLDIAMETTSGSHANGVLAVPPLKDPKKSPSMNRLAGGGQAQSRGSSTPTNKRLVQLNSVASAGGGSDSEMSRPNSVAGTPGSNKPGRVGFSKARKSERKQILASAEMLGTPLGASPARTPTTPYRLSKLSATLPSQDQQALALASGGELDTHIVMQNSTAMDDDDNTSELSLTDAYPQSPPPMATEQPIQSRHPGPGPNASVDAAPGGRQPPSSPAPTGTQSLTHLSNVHLSSAEDQPEAALARDEGPVVDAAGSPASSINENMLSAEASNGAEFQPADDHAPFHSDAQPTADGDNESELDLSPDLPNFSRADVPDIIKRPSDLSIDLRYE
ncbi:uncharacterized protein LOC135819546 [Sycon ciliatum]|uniref:uncharacterized protein LOC135819546 n=1 Tax=Sycon ciliatum TaxID=27933 RepID=UPI0031F6FC64